MKINWSLVLFILMIFCVGTNVATLVFAPSVLTIIALGFCLVAAYLNWRDLGFKLRE